MSWRYWRDHVAPIAAGVSAATAVALGGVAPETIGVASVTAGVAGAGFAATPIALLILAQSDRAHENAAILPGLTRRILAGLHGLSASGLASAALGIAAIATGWRIAGFCAAWTLGVNIGRTWQSVAILRARAYVNIEHDEARRLAEEREHWLALEVER